MKQKREAEVDFDKKIISLQVVNGTQASLMCSVRALGQHEVSWIHVDKQLLLTTQDVVRTTNPRIGIRRQNQTFILVIDKAAMDDVGYYACRINSHPPKSQVGFLDVLVPPYFLNTSLESDATVTVKEYSNVVLDCRATANPPPIITWRREDGKAIPAHVSAREISGDVLTLNEVTRRATGVYECAVTSGVSPPISRRITLLVQFAPLIRIPSQVVLAGMGQNATLECSTESHPLGRLEWFDPAGRRIGQAEEANPKYSLSAEKTYHFSVVYRLTVSRVGTSDSGRYSCLIRNDFGAAQSELSLHVAENVKHSTSGTVTPVSPVTTATPQTNAKREHQRKNVAVGKGVHHYWPLREHTTTIQPFTKVTELHHRRPHSTSGVTCGTIPRAFSILTIAILALYIMH